MKFKKLKKKNRYFLGERATLGPGEQNRCSDVKANKDEKNYLDLKTLKSLDNIHNFLCINVFSVKKVYIFGFWLFPQNAF